LSVREGRSGETRKIEKAWDACRGRRGGGAADAVGAGGTGTPHGASAERDDRDAIKNDSQLSDVHVLDSCEDLACPAHAGHRWAAATPGGLEVTLQMSKTGAIRWARVDGWTGA
jgi:hypothetical protein